MQVIKAGCAKLTRVKKGWTYNLCDSTTSTFCQTVNRRKQGVKMGNQPPQRAQAEVDPSGTVRVS